MHTELSVDHREGCTPIRLRSGRRYTIRIARPSLRLTLAIDPAKARSERYTLVGSDGSVSRSLTAKDDAIPGDRGLSLDFPRLSHGQRYSLRVDVPASHEHTGKSFFLFRGLPLELLLAQRAPRRYRCPRRCRAPFLRGRNHG